MNLVTEYLLHSFLYYELNVSLYSDAEFDCICDKIYKDFDNITHMHKHLLDKESLKAHTGYTIQYPNIVKHTAVIMYMKKTNVNPLSFSGYGEENTPAHEVLILLRKFYME